MLQAFPLSDLEAYLDEALPPEEMARIEKAARKDRSLVGQLASIHARRGAGVHSLGEIWRRHQLSCPSREELGNYVLATLAAAEAGYVAFHVGVVGCRYCQANLTDLEQQRAETEQAGLGRRRRFFQSSAGYLRKAN